jgi:hypothetical protein
MSLDDVLIAMLVGGIGLSIAYVRAEYRRWRGQGVTEARREIDLRDLHAARLFEQHEKRLAPSLVQLQTFGEIQAANPEDLLNVEAARRSTGRSAAKLTFPFVERRKHPRQHAAQ